jgi:phosphoglycolate phosphatase
LDSIWRKFPHKRCRDNATHEVASTTGDAIGIGFVIRGRLSVLFDLDGTLVDSLPAVCAALNRMLARYERPPLSVENLKPLIGEGARPMIEKAFVVSGTMPSDRIPEAIATYQDFYREAPMHGSRVYPGTMDVFEELAKQDVKIGVCTNKPDSLAEIVLRDTGLARYVGALVGGDFPDRKPSGRHVHETLLRLSCSAPAAVLIGDSSHDILAAKAAGIYAIGVTWGYSTTDLRPLGADMIVSHMDELTSAISDLERRRS